MNIMNTKSTTAIVGAVVGLALVTNAVMAQQAETGKPRQKFKGPVKVFILAGQSNMEGHGGVKTLDRLGQHPTHGYLLKKIKRDDGSFVVRDDVFVSYQKADEQIKRPLSVGMGAWGADWFGPELMFGIEMGDHFKEPVLLIKTCWGGHSLYGNFRPPSAGKAAYETGYKPEEIGASYHKMVKEVRECLANLDTDFPQWKGLKTEICGFVWFQGWNDMCQPGDEIRQQVYDEYCPLFVHLVQDLRAEFKMPNLPVVVGELGVGGETADKNMMDFRAGQAKIATCPELKGTLGYVRTAPFWYPELDELPRKMESEEHRVRQAVAVQLKEQLNDKPERTDPKKMEQLVKEAGDKALEKDAAYQQAKQEADRHVCNWYCHYQGSARVYCMVGYSLAEAMKLLLTTEGQSVTANPAPKADAVKLVRLVGAEQWAVFETSFGSGRKYANPFVDVEVDVVFRSGDLQWRVPAFWAGDDNWTVRFAPPVEADYTFQVKCSDPTNKELNGNEQPLRVTAYTGDNLLLRHGFLRVSANKRYFEHADGTPFFWLGDTWWKCLCQRMTWEGFQELTADRKAKGFSVIQIVCGPYPDEGVFEASWENEGGKPYLNREFTEVNPAYFEYADRRLKHLVESGLVPAIVGGWGRGDCDGMKMAGVAGIKRHWRNLIARYGAYPTIWIVGGESGGPEWTEVARYVQQTDPYHRPSTMHPFDSGRTQVTDETVINFDMLQTGHGDWEAARGAIPKLIAAYNRKPVMPVMIGEYCYEGHMQTAFQNVQRYVFWGSMLSGSAGLTYGAAGVWHASVEGDPGTANVYDWTTWKEGMDYPGSTQLGLGKKLLAPYPWARFEPHPEWTDAGAFAAGIPGEVRFIYQPHRGVYNWDGVLVKGLERDVPYHGFYFNPGNAKRYDLGTFISAGPASTPFEGHAQPLIFADKFDGADASAWKDYGTPTQRKDGRLVGGKGMVTVLEKSSAANLMASVEARSDAEAGIILRFQDADHYLVALYTPLLKAIYIHDRKNGDWGQPLGQVALSEIGPTIRLTAAACGDFAAMVITDGTKMYSTPSVKVSNVSSGKSGLWLFQVGEQQEYDNFELSQTPFAPSKLETTSDVHRVVTDEFKAPNVPSPQDWVLVLERAGAEHVQRSGVHQFQSILP